MNKLGRLIRVKFICTDELLKKLLGDYHSEDHYKEMKDKFAKKELIKFNPFDKPAFEKELLTFSNTFTFFSYKDFAETLKEYEQFTVLSYRITDNNSDIFKRKEYSVCWACDISGLVMDKCLEKYVDLEQRNYHVERTKVGAKWPVKKVYYYGSRI
tara:strand:- start:522 stop:989 length:468 start_codon:yes stop_codon:yes gene_type:complete